MTSWMKERDRLVEQTKAFVQNVAAQRPLRVDVTEVIPPTPPRVTAPASDPSSIPTPSPVTPNPISAVSADKASLADAEAMMSLIAQSLPSLRPDPVAPAPESIVVAQPRQPVRPLAATPTVVPAPKQSTHAALSEREIIAQRVANFRANQRKLIRERDNNYAIVQAQIRATLDTDPT